jgi:uncharacterized protein with ParB-like and HNH nuclease domain
MNRGIKMSSGFKTPISVKEAIDRVHNRDFLLPAIQRKFIWSSSQVELLFDSIMRGYPISSFMFWEIKDEKMKSEYKFYEFLKEYREFYKENNEEINTTGVKDFMAVIDGQQRLTSLYIGFRGTYAYKMPRKWWRNDEDSLPTRALFLNLLEPVNQEYDNQKKYDFRFLSKPDLVRLGDKNKYHWFKLEQLLDFSGLPDLNKYIVRNNLQDNEFANDTLLSMYERFNSDKLINYYSATEQDPDKVLDIFIRTNSGGTPLSFSDLLMSIASANWKKIDARKEIDDTVNQVFSISNAGFRIDKDFVLKTCLFLFVENIRFELKNFGFENVQKFEKNWRATKKSIIAAFELIYRLGFNNTTFRAKNAAIPLVYYIYYNNLAGRIVKANYDAEDLSRIKKWINLSFIKSIFRGHTDAVLVRIRRVLRENNGARFPLLPIRKAFESDTDRNYHLDVEFVDGLLTSAYGSNESFYILSMLYPDLDYYNQDFHKDHIHPASIFRDKKIIESIKNETTRSFMENPDNWNSILNLQLLNGDMNKSKTNKSLAAWADECNISHRKLYLDEDVSLDINNFERFIENRKANLKKALSEIFGLYNRTTS